jgi:ABC-type transporter Mla subunit MlaD
VAQTVRGHSERLGDIERTMNAIIGTVNEHTRRFDEIADVLNKHDRKLDDLAEGLTTLRSTVSHYHNTVIGHGMMPNDFEERLKRSEDHLELGPAAA